MKYSISKKLFQTVIVINFLVLLVLTIAILLFTKSLQKEFLQQDYAEERDFILSEYDTQNSIHHRTNKILIEFIPKNLYGQLPEYALFRNVPEGIGMQQSFEANIYLMNIEKISIGTFYHARDITQVLERERLFFAVIIVIFIVTMLLSLVLSYTSSQRIVQPLKYLSDYIASSKVGEKNALITTDFQDIELHNIAVVFNDFLTELDQFIVRERSLVGLASHELKTPVAIICGAVEVLKSRYTLPEPALGSLLRIENASEEMRTSIPVLLELSRRSGKAVEYQNLNIKKIVLEVVNDLSELFSVDTRISLDYESESSVKADKDLAKMLIRNLLQNSLEHTSGKIHLLLSSASLQISDQGGGVEDAGFQELKKNMPNIKSNFTNGLGLYIVTLISERLKWSLDISTKPSKGSVITVSFS
ncbi:MAG: sensor histidine kinase [Arenicella sp.]